MVADKSALVHINRTVYLINFVWDVLNPVKLDGSNKLTKMSVCNSNLSLTLSQAQILFLRFIVFWVTHIIFILGVPGYAVLEAPNLTLQEWTELVGYARKSRQ